MCDIYIYIYVFFDEVSINNMVIFFLIPQGNRRETRLLGILSFVHSTVWKVLFGKVIAVVFVIVYIFFHNLMVKF